MDNAKSPPDIISRIARLHDELATFRFVERHFKQQLQRCDQPNESGNPKYLKKALSKIRRKIRSLESRVSRRS